MSDLNRRKICGIFEKNYVTENEEKSEYEMIKKTIDNKQN